MSQWQKVKIGDICKIVKGTTGIANAEPGEYPLVVTAKERKTCSSYQFDCEAVCIPLVSSSGHGKKSLKNVHYQSGKFALGTILCAVIPNNPEQLDARFLYQYLHFYKDTILVSLMKGAANVSLSMKDIATVEIPLPPIENQRELSDLFITLQENQKKLVAETEQQLEYTKLLRQNILQDAIEGKLTAGWRKSHPVIKGNPDYDAEALFEKIQKGEVSPSLKPAKRSSASSSAGDTPATPPFEIPESWKWVKLMKLGSTQTGTTPNTTEQKNFGNDIPFIKPEDITDKGINYDNYSLSLVGAQKSRIATKNSILMVCIGGGIGKCYFTDRDICFNQQINSITPTNRRTYLFLYNVMRSLHFQKEAWNRAMKSSTPIINKSKWETILVPLPPLKEQEEIVTKVDNLLAKVTELENQIQERKTYTKHLIQSILKETFGRNSK